MATATLAARVAQLEKTVATLVKKQEPGRLRKSKKLKAMAQAPLPGLPKDFLQPRQPGRDDWMTVVGMFDGDEVMKRIIERGASIRRAESRKARRG
ncbi:MAG: hypothetical protein ACKVY0_09450 [Prosthecobacter sp.]|uniref:hypothetical protein n=1 Tax=Prosthecobacter sp. TaxID=1965333 RepID=UPI0038FD959E